MVEKAFLIKDVLEDGKSSKQLINEYIKDNNIYKRKDSNSAKECIVAEKGYCIGDAIAYINSQTGQNLNITDYELYGKMKYKDDLEENIENPSMNRTFIETSLFTLTWNKLGLSDETLNKVQCAIMQNPEAGDLIQGTSGARKLRIELPNTGKLGGARVIYVDFITRDIVYLLTVYAKKDKSDLNKSEKDLIYDIVKTIKEEV